MVHGGALEAGLGENVEGLKDSPSEDADDDADEAADKSNLDWAVHKLRHDVDMVVIPVSVDPARDDLAFYVVARWRILWCRGGHLEVSCETMILNG